MKKIMNICAAIALLFASATVANAQEADHTAGYNFVSVKGGAQATLTYYDFGKLVTPQYGIAVGRYFNDKVGARLDISGYQNKGGFCVTRFPFLSEDKGYKFNACTGDLDLLMNMTNIINPNRASHAFNWNLIAGFGVNYTWDTEEFEAVTAPMHYYVGQILCSDKHASFNGRLATQVEYNIVDNFAVNLELQANYKNDQYNYKFNDQCDWQVAAYVGVAYKFGMPKVKKATPVVEEPAPAPVVEEPAPAPVVEEKKPEPVVEKKPEPVVKPEPLKETVYYQIRESELDNENTINKVVAWCNKYPGKGITVSGYADKGTGNPTINKKYSEARATKVADAIKAKGIAADRISVQAYGDTVQPFADNDMNRCVIIVGE